MCSNLKLSRWSDTLSKLQAKNPQGSVDFDRTSFADMDALREEDNWLNVSFPRKMANFLEMSSRNFVI